MGRVMLFSCEYFSVYQTSHIERWCKEPERMIRKIDLSVLSEYHRYTIKEYCDRFAESEGQKSFCFLNGHIGSELR
jgi:hypothetical protein